MGRGDFRVNDTDIMRLRKHRKKKKKDRPKLHKVFGRSEFEIHRKHLHVTKSALRRRNERRSSPDDDRNTDLAIVRKWASPMRKEVRVGLANKIIKNKWVWKVGRSALVALIEHRLTAAVWGGGGEHKFTSNDGSGSKELMIVKRRSNEVIDEG